ncbi:MAG: BglII/BstYI family type II restriction endonuclease [Bdellovibrionota bacterium]
MAIDQLPALLRKHYEIHEWKHACAILETDFPAEWADILDVLTRFRVKKSWIAQGGGSKTELAKWIDGELGKKGWREKQFDTKITVDKVSTSSPTHKVDCFKNGIALEIEWNNKDPFFDRDLNNFRLLFDLRVISVGIILTRCDELQEIFDSLGRGSSYGNSTTHMSKLLPRINGGGGGGCPLLIFGITKRLYDPKG